ncbi:hypothetical protein JCM11641_003428 [Rhodosporidiobolus odoratus]
MTDTVHHASYTVHNGGPTLSYALHLPCSALAPIKAALIAHPYGRLGGCKEDHVVASLVETLAREGWAVIRYDARGAGESGGSASWTGAAEVEDYRLLVQDVLLPLFLPPAPSHASHGPTQTPSSVAGSNMTAQISRKIDVLLCGYSFGSLAASSCPPPFHPSLSIQTSYLLISYPLSVLWALSLFRSGPYTSALRDLVRRGENRVLAVYGDGDQFSAVGRLRAWANELDNQKTGARTWEAVEIEGADHLWQDRGKKRVMLETVQDWLMQADEPRSGFQLYD